MSLMFLAEGVLNQLSSGMNPLGALAGFAVGLMIVFLLVAIAILVYISLAHMAIARRVGMNDNLAGLAWVFGLGPLLISYIVSGAGWWPWLLLLVGYFVLYMGLMLMAVSAALGVILMILGFIALLVFTVFTIIWMCKMFKAVGRSIWFGLLPVILVVVGYLLVFMALLAPAMAIIGMLILLAAGILYLVFLGIAAWGGGGSMPVEVAKPAMRKK